MKTVAVILAGGQGSRIGGAKPLRLLAGMTLLDRASAQARLWSDVVAIAVRDESQAAGTVLPRLLDEPGVDGPLAGLVAALRYASEQRADVLLTIPADMPFLPKDLAGRLEAALGDHRAALASSGGRLHPVCGLWRTEALASVPAYLASGRRSLRGFAEAVGYGVVDWPAEPADPFFNVNSIEDLEAAEHRLRG